jgi:hypothetical protein
MAHCPAERLGDLRGLLSEIARWPEIVERKPGIFYLKRDAFLHFHVDGAERRWADVRDGKSWGAELDLAFGASAAARARFLREARRRYEATLAAKAKRR